MERNILLIHPQLQIQAACRRILAQENFQVISAEDARDAVSLIRSANPCLVLTGIRMEGRDGFAVLHDVQEHAKGVPVIAIAIHSSIAGAVSFITSGGADYIPNPFSAGQLVQAVRQALSRADCRPGKDQEQLSGQSEETETTERIIGSSPAVRQLREKLARIAATDVHVLLTGETGTGKELAAREIHARSRRQAKPFMIVDCAALPPGLIESEMFGHVRGAFTGAERERTGLLQRGDHGTIFLDEIGELELASQGRLLRLLEDGSIRRVGESARSSIDLRFVAATNRDLERSVREKNFRKDLYYRLKVVEIVLPPLRERPEDIPALADHFYKYFNKLYGREDLPDLPLELTDAMRGYPWPGNIRELKNLMERVVVMTPGQEALAEEIENFLGKGNACSPSLPVREDLASFMTELIGGADGMARYGEIRDTLTDHFDLCYFRRLFALHGGNISEMARQAGMTRKSVYRKLALNKIGYRPA